jgi:hypothetical protein
MYLEQTYCRENNTNTTHKVKIGKAFSVIEEKYANNNMNFNTFIIFIRMLLLLHHGVSCKMKIFDFEKKRILNELKDERRWKDLCDLLRSSTVLVQAPRPSGTNLVESKKNQQATLDSIPLFIQTSNLNKKCWDHEVREIL